MSCQLQSWHSCPVPTVADIQGTNQATIFAPSGLRLAMLGLCDVEVKRVSHATHAHEKEKDDQ